MGRGPGRGEGSGVGYRDSQGCIQGIYTFDPVKYFYSLPPSFKMFLQSADRGFSGFLTDLTPHFFSVLLPHIHLSFILPRSPLSTVERHLATLSLSNIFFLFFSLSH